MKKSKKQKKFFGHPICNKCVRSIPSPLKAWAAMLIETEGLGEEEVKIDMKQTYEQGRKQNRSNIGLNDTAEWIYKKITKEVRPTLTRQPEVALVENIETGKDRSQARAVLCVQE